MSEMRNPLKWWWLIFYDESDVVGVSVIHAGGLREAAATAERLGCNPGTPYLDGEPLEEWNVPDKEYLERLLSKEEAEEIYERMIS